MAGHVAMPPRAHGRAGTHLLGRRSAGGSHCPQLPSSPSFVAQPRGLRWQGRCHCLARTLCIPCSPLWDRQSPCIPKC